MVRFKGEKVTFINGFLHTLNPECCPPYGTRGTIVAIVKEPFEEHFFHYTVRWDEGELAGKETVLFGNSLLPPDEMLAQCPFKPNDIVRYLHGPDENECFYPYAGTEGIVTDIVGPGEVVVQWPDGSTSGDDKWCVNISSIEHV